MLVKQGLAVVLSGCIFTRGDLETIGFQLAAAFDFVLRMTVGVLESDTVQKIQVLRMQERV